MQKVRFCFLLQVEHSDIIVSNGVGLAVSKADSASTIAATVAAVNSNRSLYKVALQSLSSMEALVAGDARPEGKAADLIELAIRQDNSLQRLVGPHWAFYAQPRSEITWRALACNVPFLGCCAWMGLVAWVVYNGLRGAFAAATFVVRLIGGTRRLSGSSSMESSARRGVKRQLGKAE